MVPKRNGRDNQRPGPHQRNASPARILKDPGRSGLRAAIGVDLHARETPMNTRDDRPCTHLRDALSTARSAADARYVEHAHALVRALCSTIELRAAVLNTARRSPTLAPRAAAIMLVSDADLVGWRAEACDLLDEAERR